MNQRIKKAGKIISALLVLFILLAVLFAALVDINQYKSEIINLVKQETGLNLEIDGELQLTIFSGLKFSADNIKLSLGEELITDIELLRLGVSAYSLYSGEPQINSVELRVRTLNIFRDKNNQFNFLPLYKNSNKKTAAATAQKNTQSIKSVILKDIQLSIEKFHYLDDLESVSVKLEQLKASLSQLPIIDHYELVIDDPRILTDYNYKGELKLKKGLVNHFQIADLSLKFKDKNGAFAADTLAFQLLQEGVKHASPPLVINAEGKLTFNIRYVASKNAVEPLWSKPDIIKIGLFDFNLPEVKIRQDTFQLETEQAHISFEEVAIFQRSQYALDNLLLKSLQFKSRQVDVSLQDAGEYYVRQVTLQLAHVPIIHKAQRLDFLSDTFLRKFAEKGRIKFHSDSLSHQSQKIDKVELSLTGKNGRIVLDDMSFHALESEARGEGTLELSTAGTNRPATWQLKIYSEKLNLKPVSALFNSPDQLEGYVTFDSQLSGELHQAKLAIFNGTVKTRADDIRVNGIDIDKILENLQKSQSVGLMDVGAVALLGPAGVLVSKGKDYQSLISSLDNKGNSKVTQLNSEISFADGIARMDDVAFATEKNRLAFKGKINTRNWTFIDFKMATLDKHGCPLYEEEMLGSINSPTIKKVSFLVGGVVNPLSSVLAKVTKPVKIPCKEIFYSGAVKAPLK